MFKQEKTMSRRQRIISHIKRNYSNGQEFHSTRVSQEMGIDVSLVSAVIGEIRDQGMLTMVRSEAGEGGRRLRHVYVMANAKSTFAKRVLQTIGHKTLSDYSDEDILAEIQRRISA